MNDFLKTILENSQGAADRLRQIKEEHAEKRARHPNVLKLQESKSASAGLPYYTMQGGELFLHHELEHANDAELKSHSMLMYEGLHDIHLGDMLKSLTEVMGLQAPHELPREYLDTVELVRICVANYTSRVLFGDLAQHLPEDRDAQEAEVSEEVDLMQPHAVVGWQVFYFHTTNQLDFNVYVGRYVRKPGTEDTVIIEPWSEGTIGTNR